MHENSLSELKSLLIDVPVRFASIPANIASLKPSPNKWSKKEILGHLCDSAINNLSRFVRMQYEDEPVNIHKYNQNKWVKYNGYNGKSPQEILDLWKCLNSQIIHIISTIPEKKLNITCDIGDGDIKTLAWLLEEYVNHMKHHLDRIFSD